MKTCPSRCWSRHYWMAFMACGPVPNCSEKRTTSRIYNFCRTEFNLEAVEPTSCSTISSFTEARFYLVKLAVPVTVLILLFTFLEGDIGDTFRLSGVWSRLIDCRTKLDVLSGDLETELPMLSAIQYIVLGSGSTLPLCTSSGTC